MPFLPSVIVLAVIYLLAVLASEANHIAILILGLAGLLSVAVWRRFRPAARNMGGRRTVKHPGQHTR